MSYTPSSTRYETMPYNRCGKSGILLPAISLGLWHNFGGVDNFETGRVIIRAAFDKGVTHIDLANNYGPPPGSAEENFGSILKKDFPGYLRDELIISSKAGYNMWPGPYGDWGSRKYLIASLNQSLQRMQLDYVDIFYSHRPDPNTPLEETMMALHDIVKSGKALYAGLSNYRLPEAKQAIQILKDLGTPCLIHQPKYSMFERWVEDGLVDELEANGIGCIPFSPLAQGLLTNKYLQGNIPEESRAAKAHGALQPSAITPQVLSQLNALNNLAQKRGQSLAQMALAWILKDKRITTVLIGVSSVAQLNDNLATLNNLAFTNDELTAIEKILKAG
ncbi:L-glyceraldehyde 3-phosphate reductase [Ferruginibacter paludis]|uniref:L-glyceraldehyde 3-phosphate reductase n=1 Tax=Ferruginibacter paludis TaxID=1310417 RepID=UPI0025B2F8FE|nr:L-glyceraldehyde 3-phosphate reductase [Ferruginibacter paludis]MDN3659104.1 L-glyceraldehyde 3-phosphate reductase [Ferruginibacter paludis]